MTSNAWCGLASIQAPATTIWLAEGGSMHRVCSLNWAGYSNYAPGAFTRHNEGCNFVFVDGHAKWLSRSAVLGAQGVDDRYYQ